MTRICLVRHGETDWNRAGILQGKTDIPLNRMGRKQAEKSVTLLQANKWDTLITSPLKRAKQTAEIIQNHIQIPLIQREEFMERGYGIAEGLSPEQRAIQFPDQVYPNQESMSTLTSRVMTGVEWIHQSYVGENILLVTHGDVIHTVLAEISHEKISIRGRDLFNASLSEIQYENGKWSINYYNKVDHLPE